MKLGAVKQGLENTHRPKRATETRKEEEVEGEPTWGVVVQDSITDTDLQDESSEQLFHMRQQGV